MQIEVEFDRPHGVFIWARYKCPDGIDRMFRLEQKPGHDPYRYISTSTDDVISELDGDNDKS